MPSAERSASGGPFGSTTGPSPACRAARPTGEAPPYLSVWHSLGPCCQRGTGVRQLVHQFSGE